MMKKTASVLFGLGALAALGMGSAQAGDAAAMLIAEEHTADAPVVVSGFGPQLRIYTVHGPDALDSTRLNEHDLPIAPSNDWTLALPATGLDLELARSALAGLDHIEVYDPTNEPAPTQSHNHDPTNDEIVIDLSALEA